MITIEICYQDMSLMLLGNTPKRIFNQISVSLSFQTREVLVHFVLNQKSHTLRTAKRGTTLRLKGKFRSILTTRLNVVFSLKYYFKSLY